MVGRGDDFRDRSIGGCAAAADISAPACDLPQPSGKEGRLTHCWYYIQLAADTAEKCHPPCFDKSIWENVMIIKLKKKKCWGEKKWRRE